MGVVDMRKASAKLRKLSGHCRMCGGTAHTTKQHARKAVKARVKSKRWRKATAKSNRLRLTGKPSWNKGIKGSVPGFSSDPVIEAERRRKISEAKIGKCPPAFGFHCWYKSKKRDLKISMRSTWEVAFAKKLDKWKMKWKYEPKGFLLGRGNWNGSMYYPDFYLPEFDLYIEVKGYLRADNKRKLKRFRKRYPDIRWMMLQKEELEMLGVFTKDKSTRKQANALFITD